MTHQISPHLDFCTPGKNQDTEQGINPKPSKEARYLSTSSEQFKA